MMSRHKKKAVKETPKAHTREPASKSEIVGRSNMQANDLIWWPYRSLTRSLLQAHHNATALVEINRALFDEMREIARREQDYMLELSGKFLQQPKTNDRLSNGDTVAQTEPVDEFVETAIAGVHEFGQALSNAQVRSMEALRGKTH